ncbi:hypothetical protein M422DRAFT_261668 [Sphaerobolus stellatus SS14]|uniref:Uncharacterized protein n=1 Tax=Sphaerobolus stellatus (strain SS14) TaxID=990650 RepID=A0A0C9TZX6_SPHS4|nr:hypothetical protein M422DRAFT_261668 [Sphaerobolus stellatus SS14]
MASSLEDLAIDFIGRQHPNIPCMDLSTTELPELKYLTVSGGYQAAPVEYITRWTTSKLQYLAETFATLAIDVPLLTHLEFDWSYEFLVLESGHLNISTIRIHARNPRRGTVKCFNEQLG